jgi:beta-glucosidase
VQSELLQRVKATGKPVVVVLVNGRPLALEKEAASADALVEAWQPGTRGGQAIADVLFGHCNPSGKLAVSFPRNLGQVPIWYSSKNTGRPFDPACPNDKYRSIYLGCPNDPLFPFGFGLSYTAFDYANLRVDRRELPPGGKITASIDITNTGPRQGDETVQLYIHARSSSVTRPVLELKGFQKLSLNPGERRTVEFTIGEKELTFLRRDMTWGTEPGPFDVIIGPNSKQLQALHCELRMGNPPDHPKASPPILGLK